MFRYSACQVPYIMYIKICLDLMAKVNASPKKKVQAKLNTSGQLKSPPADPSVNAPRKFSGFTGKMSRPASSRLPFVLKLFTKENSYLAFRKLYAAFCFMKKTPACNIIYICCNSGVFYADNLTERSKRYKYI